MPLPDDAPAGPSNADFPVPDHVQCFDCDYPLRGLPPTGDCPECGRPIPDTLKYQPRPEIADWLDHLTSGTSWLGLSISLGFISGCILAGSLWPIVAVITLLLIFGPGAMAIYRLTEPDPTGLTAGSSRKIARNTMMAAVIFAVTAIVGAPFLHAQPVDVIIAGMVVVSLVAASLLWMISCTALFRWLGKIAFRLGHRRLKTSYNGLFQLGGIVTTTAILAGLIALALFLIDDRSNDSLREAATTTMSLAVIAWFPLMLGGACAIVPLGSTLSEAAERSRQLADQLSNEKTQG
ncbi:MAG: hypothetical protein R3336_01480 [Phycisphaeraceae bacterium]|nr:hypothetical protein [Phycisphaeraceae bacterium]